MLILRSDVNGNDSPNGAEPLLFGEAILYLKKGNVLPS